MKNTIHEKEVVMISVVSLFRSPLHIVTVSFAKCRICFYHDIIQRLFEVREKTSLWCIAHVVTNSVVSEPTVDSVMSLSGTV